MVTLDLKGNSLLNFLTLQEQIESHHRKNPKLLPTPDFSFTLFSAKLENQKVFFHNLINTTAQ